jgi:hypothetical protein
MPLHGSDHIRSTIPTCAVTLVLIRHRHRHSLHSSSAALTACNRSLSYHALRLPAYRSKHVLEASTVLFYVDSMYLLDLGYIGHAYILSHMRLALANQPP